VEEVGDAWGGGKDSKRAHHILICVWEGGRAEYLREAVVDFGEDIEEGKEGLVVVEREGLYF
jgi:hypothetical protein